MGGWKYGQKDGLKSGLHQPMGPVRSGCSLPIGPLMHVPRSRPDDKPLRLPITVLGAVPFAGLWVCGSVGVEVWRLYPSSSVWYVHSIYGPALST